MNLVKNRRIFSSVVMLVETIRANPALGNISAFAPLTSLLKTENAPRPGGCGGCKRNNIVRSYQGIYESAFSSMQDSDKQKMKDVLNVQEICYYVNGKGGTLELRCF